MPSSRGNLVPLIVTVCRCCGTRRRALLHRRQSHCGQCECRREYHHGGASKTQLATKKVNQGTCYTHVTHVMPATLASCNGRSASRSHDISETRTRSLSAVNVFAWKRLCWRPDQLDEPRRGQSRAKAMCALDCNAAIHRRGHGATGLRT